MFRFSYNRKAEKRRRRYRLLYLRMLSLPYRVMRSIPSTASLLSLYSSLSFSTARISSLSVGSHGALSYTGVATTEKMPSPAFGVGRELKDFFVRVVPSFVSKVSLFTVLLLFQMFDAVLTYIGVLNFGIEMEGNPLIRSLMGAVGPLAAILTVKFFAVICVFCLWNLRGLVSWIPKAMLFLSLYYLFFAILPWSYLVFLV